MVALAPILGGVASSLIGGIFGNKQQKNQQQNAKDLAQQQLNNSMAQGWQAYQFREGEQGRTFDYDKQAADQRTWNQRGLNDQAFDFNKQAADQQAWNTRAINSDNYWQQRGLNDQAFDFNKQTLDQQKWITKDINEQGYWHTRGLADQDYQNQRGLNEQDFGFNRTLANDNYSFQQGMQRSDQDFQVRKAGVDDEIFRRQADQRFGFERTLANDNYAFRNNDRAERERANDEELERTYQMRTETTNSAREAAAGAFFGGGNRFNARR